ncbi:MAG: response regulator [Bdellovibrionales bacterium GWB1_55_8]|nr:MAG: response regulator [Bdellovibrionales bacterium GWB1_55_8]
MSDEKLAAPGQYLTFMLNGQTYGVPIGAVREINRVSEITPVPQTPAYVSGVMNLRGKVIPVVNLRRKFSLEEQSYTKDTCIIVVESERQVGVIVDSVKAVMDFGSKQIEARPPLGNDAELAFVLGIGKVEEQVVILLDIVQAVRIGDPVRQAA